MVTSIETDSVHYARAITYAIIEVMEANLGNSEAHAETIDRARSARTVLTDSGDAALPLAAFLMDRCSEVYFEAVGEEHPTLSRIADELRAYTANAAWEDSAEAIMEQRAHLFALAVEVA